MTTTVVLLVIGAVFVGAWMRALFGFGEAIVSMPLLALLPVPLPTAVTLIGFAGLTVALLTVTSGWRHMNRAVMVRLAIATIVGIPAGLVLLRTVPANWITAGLGVCLIGYGTYCLLKTTLSKAIVKPLLNERGWVLPFGFAAGMLGSAYNVNGVPVVIYGTLRRWQPDQLRGTLQVHFLLSGALVVAGHGLGGLWSVEAFQLYGYSLPAIVGATVFGTWMSRRIPTAKFERYLLGMIIVLGIVLLLPRGSL